MTPSADEKREFWTRAYLAALSGMAGNVNDPEAAKRAVTIADEALKTFIQKMLSF
ncbi:hypothetical protein HX819_28330 [Pseudomonas sp. D6002]|uniref:hypothetical protein n=1 Tax=unclassified Pseudomonas TaxID=196821 RepID=UPI0015A0F38F|nr:MULTISPECIES: hypothetical protein [unclassified Pseudomonas]NVZ95226.1 hypothetical protein [Pseudomonas sp. B6001]NWB18359.1 hypothetical protein [Pseudomonas sp. D6002]NWB62328.1 hypothetical protein [Pseudomonas sp. F1002]NWB68022.1 hypothetical protein [Pseudomonas sp. I8001]NWC06482.1 hypothetical protein [Pseudomonas sp. G1002]